MHYIFSNIQLSINSDLWKENITKLFNEMINANFDCSSVIFVCYIDIFSTASSSQYSEDVVELPKSEDCQSNVLEELYLFQKLYQSPNRTDYRHFELIQCSSYIDVRLKY